MENNGILSFELIKLEDKPAKSGFASWVGKLTWKIRVCFYSFLDFIHFPGIIKCFEHKDLVTGQQLKIHVGFFFVKITIDGRDYYFRRLSGKFDGTGSSIGCGKV